MASPRDYKNTIIPNWCPGCGDYGIQNAISAVCAKKGWANEDITLISGIGCSSRIGGYQYCYGAHTTHGRALPFAQGIKCANKDTHMIVCSGDGDSYAIGLGHAMHAMKRNMDITYLVFDNQVYGLTKGQASPTADPGSVTPVQVEGNLNIPFNPVLMAIAAGAGFVARSFSGKPDHLREMMKQAIRFKGYAMVDILQPCVSFNKINTFAWYKSRCREVSHDPRDWATAMTVASTFGEEIPIGVLYREERPSKDAVLPQCREGALYRRPVDMESVRRRMLAYA